MFKNPREEAEFQNIFNRKFDVSKLKEKFELKDGFINYHFKPIIDDIVVELMFKIVHKQIVEFNERTIDTYDFKINVFNVRIKDFNIGSFDKLSLVITYDGTTIISKVFRSIDPDEIVYNIIPGPWYEDFLRALFKFKIVDKIYNEDKDERHKEALKEARKRIIEKLEKEYKPIEF